MLNSVVFSDEIALWWDRAEFDGAPAYKLYVDGAPYAECERTHYTFSDLLPDRVYKICIEGVFPSGKTVKRTKEVKTSEQKARIDVTAAPYLAVGDGKTVNTAAIQRALDDCTEGQYVYFPSGIFMSGALDVHSNSELYFEEGAVLRGTANAEDYLPKIRSRFEGAEMLCYRSLLNLGKLDSGGGYNCKNVILRGKGAVIGGGKPLATAMLEAERHALGDFLKENAEYVKTCENADTVPGRVRGRLINMSNCENVVISGLKAGYSPSWNIHFIYSKDIVTLGCEIYSANLYGEDGSLLAEQVWNGDGWDPDSSENCAVFGTVFNTGDDCIAIKSGKNPEGNLINRPTKNIYVFDCTVVGGHSLSVGSEMSGGVENVFVWDCDLRNSFYGAQIKGTRKRGGYVKNVHISDSVIPSFYVRSVTYNDDGEGAKVPPVFSGFYLDDVTLTGTEVTPDGGREYVLLCGFDGDEHRVRDVRLHGVRFVGADKSEAIKTEFADVPELTDISFV